MMLSIAFLFYMSGCSKDNSIITSALNTSASYSQIENTIIQSGQAYTSSIDDVSGVLVTNSGIFTLTHSVIATSGNSSSLNNSSFYGLNAGILAESGSTINLSNNKITTTGKGANGVFAYGTATVTMTGDTVDCSGQYAHAIMCSGGGTLTASNVVLTTTGANSAAIATDHGGGTITVKGATVKTSGKDSPGIYSTGDIMVADATILASGSEAAVIEGANSIKLNNTTLTSNKSNKWGVLIYQSMSGDSEDNMGIFTMTGGSLAYSSSLEPLFYVTNTTGYITLKGVALTVASGAILKAASGSWGTSGYNGGYANLLADEQKLVGNIEADSYSTLNIRLQNKSSLIGHINIDNRARSANVTLDASSTWTLTADSYVNAFTDVNGISGTTITNINGNGFNIYCNSSASSAIGGKIYSLIGGGSLIPI